MNLAHIRSKLLRFLPRQTFVFDLAFLKFEDFGMALPPARLILLLRMLLAVPLLHNQNVLCRELNVEEHPSWRPLCNSTVQGRHLRSDDRGYVCNIRDINPRTGCCTEDTRRYPCLGCNMASKCCNMYEYCVSCCLDPSRTSSEVALKVKVSKQLTSGTSSTLFEYCTGRCRHNSASVVHENAYVSDEHHCFLPQEQHPDTDEEPERADSDFGDLTIVIARQGQSCDSACSERQKICKLSTLHALNKCTVLKKYLGCREACIASTGTDQPSEVVKTAPKHMHPGSCMFSTQKVPFTCEGSHPYTRRLCPCGLPKSKLNRCNGCFRPLKERCCASAQNVFVQVTWVRSFR